MRRALFAAATLALTACESSPPCTECPNVGGVYFVTFDAVDPEKSSCKQVAFTGGAGQVLLQQDGSALSIADEDMPLDGTLLENNTTSLRTRTPITSIDGLRINANTVVTFRGADGAWNFDGTLEMSVVEPSCHLSVPFKAKQVSSQQ